MFETREIYFIRIFFRILIAFFITSAICVFVFDINDSVVFQVGEIMAENPQLDYKAPFEAIPDSVYVKEGQVVKAGDTLMVLHSDQLEKDFNTAETLFRSLKKSNASISGLIQIAFDKIANLRNEKRINLKTHDSQKEKLRNELKSASDKVVLASEQLSHVGAAKLKIDSALFKQNVISKLDMTNSYDNYSNYKSSLLVSELSKNQIQSSVSGLDNDYLKTQNTLDMRLIELQERVKELGKQKTESDKEIATAFDNLNFLREQVRKQYLVCTMDGEVQNLHNIRFKTNFINKDELLLSVTPRKGKYFAKVTLPQRDIRYVKVGQEAHLKVDAFNFYNHGILKGEVSYIPERKPKEDFFVVIDLIPGSAFELKAGYSLRGEIIVERLSIFMFIKKKLFRSIEDASTTTAPPAS